MGDIVCIRNTSSGFDMTMHILQEAVKLRFVNRLRMGNINTSTSTTHQDYSNGDIKAIKMYCFGYVEGQLVHKMQK